MCYEVKWCSWFISKLFPKLSFRYRIQISKEEINNALQEVDKELGQTLFVAESNIKTNVPTSHLIDRRRTSFNWLKNNISHCYHSDSGVRIDDCRRDSPTTTPPITLNDSSTDIFFIFYLERINFFLILPSIFWLLTPSNP